MGRKLRVSWQPKGKCEEEPSATLTPGEREGRSGGFESPRKSYLKDVNCRKNGFQKKILRRFRHLLIPQNGSCSIRGWCRNLCIPHQEIDSKQYLLSRFLLYLGFRLEFLETFLPHSVQSLKPRYCCIRIFLTPKKAAKEIQIKINGRNQGRIFLERIKTIAFEEGAFHVSCLCVTCISTSLCVMRLLCLSGVGSTTCSLYT